MSDDPRISTTCYRRRSYHVTILHVNFKTSAKMVRMFAFKQRRPKIWSRLTIEIVTRGLQVSPHTCNLRQSLTCKHAENVDVVDSFFLPTTISIATISSCHIVLQA